MTSSLQYFYANLCKRSNSSSPQSPQPCIRLTSSFLAAKSQIRPIGFKYENLRYNTKASMAEIVTPKSKVKVQVFDSEEELAVSLAKHTADLCSEISKEKDSFTIVLSGGSLVQSLSDGIEGNFWNLLILIRWIGRNGTCFGWMRQWCPRIILIAITSLCKMSFLPRYWP